MTAQEVTVHFRDGEPPTTGIITGMSLTFGGVIYVQEPDRNPLPCTFRSIERIEFHRED